jgi:hypothetical protein
MEEQMIKKTAVFALLAIISCLTSEAIYAGQPGTADAVFNRRFIQKIKPMMPYDQLVKIIGSEGAKAGEDRRSSPPAVIYHWNGDRKSALDIKVAAGKVVDATVTSPKNKKISLEKTGN